MSRTRSSTASRRRRVRLAAIPYGPYVLGGFVTSEPGPASWDDIYALATPKRSFGIVFNTGNALRGDGDGIPGGSITVSAAADAARRLASLSDDEIAERYRAELVDLFPALDGAIAETKIVRWERGLRIRRSAARSSSRP